MAAAKIFTAYPSISGSGSVHVFLDSSDSSDFLFSWGDGLQQVVGTSEPDPVTHWINVDHVYAPGDYVLQIDDTPDDPTTSAVELSVFAHFDATNDLVVTPAPLAQIVFTGSGNDTITTGIENDRISSGSGNDVIEGGAGQDVIDAGSGDDLIRGQSGSDDLRGQGGADVIHGGSENDFISGGDDGDKLYGDAGDDWIVGDAGNDLIAGGTGNDYIQAGDGNDIVRAGSGNDTVEGDAGDDVIHGDDGVDGLFGGAGDDKLYGDAGNDSLYGGEGNDKLFGGDGNDRLNGGSGQNQLTGGAGADTFVFIPPGHQSPPENPSTNDRDVILDFSGANGGDGDLIDLSGYGFSDTIGYFSQTFIGNARFSGHMGEVRFVITGNGNTAVQTDTDGDKHADFTVTLRGIHDLHASDFVLI